MQQKQTQESMSVVSRSNANVIRLPRRTGLLQKVIPGSVWCGRPFRFQPKTFCLNHPQLVKTKFYDRDEQSKSLELWKEDSTTPTIYVCTSSPDDRDARYFAGYLVVQHLNQLKSRANVVWEELTSNFSQEGRAYDNDVTRPTLLVLSGLCVDSSKVRLEKARDLVNKYYNIPRIIVGSGADPVTFASMYLRVPVNRIFYKVSPICASS